MSSSSLTGTEAWLIDKLPPKLLTEDVHLLSQEGRAQVIEVSQSKKSVYLGHARTSSSWMSDSVPLIPPSKTLVDLRFDSTEYSHGKC